MLVLNFQGLDIPLPTFQEIVNKSLDELVAVCKFRHHQTGWEWYVIAGETIGEEMLLFCYVKGDFNEFGYVPLYDIIDAGAMFCPTWKSRKVERLL